MRSGGGEGACIRDVDLAFLNSDLFSIRGQCVVTNHLQNLSVIRFMVPEIQGRGVRVHTCSCAPPPPSCPITATVMGNV